MAGEYIDDALRVLRRPDVESVTGLSRSSIYQRIGDGTFPKPIKLGLRSVGWRAGDIAAWLRDPLAYTTQQTQRHDDSQRDCI
ncbi:AlpA family transcriptional regulator [Cupriavidus gilardii]|uniref:AlpA family transcriptional regulator n=1 Tax=Cupriavidus gilardii TaxID=82541 RepID=A0ABY4VZ02_9BURK|nr:AlpA family transcriptional regulator [Cupriavidus gilardii]USE81134.1 AlpA family transcriptional regulator [Cupriavidus gilardii]